MVWLNTQCHNYPAKEGTLGGAMCTCPKCRQERADRVEVLRNEVLQKSTKNFILELKALLKKYDAVITAEDHFIGYAECGEDVRMTVEFKDYKLADIDLGGYITGEDDE